LYSSELNRLALMACLHYREGWTKDEIARYLGVSRFKVMRGLREAKERGIIRFDIDSSLLSRASLEVELVRVLGIRAALVVTAPPEAEAISYVAAAGAEYLQSSIPNGAIVGVSWGPTPRQTVAALRKQQGKQITVVELVGGVSSNAIDSGHAVALGLAQAFESEDHCHLLECPAILRRQELRDSLLDEQPLRATMAVAKAADTVIFSTGDFNFSLVLLEAGYLTSEDVAELRRANAVGSMYARFLDADGVECDTSLKGRTLGLSVEEIKSVPHKICITSGQNKIEPVHAALKGGLIDILITDEATATGLLSREQGPTKPVYSKL